MKTNIQADNCVVELMGVGIVCMHDTVHVHKRIIAWLAMATSHQMFLSAPQITLNHLAAISISQFLSSSRYFHSGPFEPV